VIVLFFVCTWLDAHCSFGFLLPVLFCFCASSLSVIFFIYFDIIFLDEKDTFLYTIDKGIPLDAYVTCSVLQLT
jgi:hypothetical protein